MKNEINESKFEPFSVTECRLGILTLLFVLVFLLIISLDILRWKTLHTENFLELRIIGFILLGLFTISFSILVMIIQYNTFLSMDNKFAYSLRWIYFAYKKKPYSVIKYNEIKKSLLISNKNGTPVLLKVITISREHYISNQEMIEDFLYNLKKKDLENMTTEKRKELSLLKTLFLKLKGGKVEERK